MFTLTLSTTGHAPIPGGTYFLTIGAGLAVSLAVIMATIPLLGRIVSVADAFDAMTTDRPYKAARTPEQAFGEFAASSERIPTNILAERLKRLDAFIAMQAEQNPGQDGAPR